MKTATSLRIALSVVAAAGMTPAFAAQPGSVYDFNIPRQPLSVVLAELSSQTGMNVYYFPANDSRGQKLLGPIKGSFTLQSAIDSVLAGGPLTATMVNDRTIVVTESQPAWRTAALWTVGEPVLMASNAPAGASTSGEIDLDRNSLEEVIVTSRKREERLVDVPVSVSVLGSEELLHRGLVSREDYMRSVPSVLLREDGVGLAEIVIRGAYADRFNSGPTVGLYFGDVPLTGYALGGSTDVKLIDIERVEVLRGPQGSLHGSNALSGAIRYIPAAPDLVALSGQVGLDYSNTSGYGGDNIAVDAVLNLPLIGDKLAVRAVVFNHEKDGYIRNVAGDDASLQAAANLFGATGLAVNKDQVGSSESSGARVSALWRPVEQLDVTLTYFTQKDAQDDRLFELEADGKYRRSDYQLGSTVGGNDDALRVDVDMLNLTLEYDLGWGSLYSSSAWLEQRFIRKWDIGSLFGAPLMPVPQTNTTDADVFTQEVRFASSFDGPFGVVAGVYYEDSATPSKQATYFGGDPVSNPFSNVLLWQTALNRQVEQKAVFGEVSYDITDSIEVTVGGRAFEYDSRFWTTFFNSIVIPNSTSDEQSGESGQTAKAGVEYKPSENAMVYASWSQGFRLGQPLATDLLRSLCDQDNDGFLDGSNVSSTLDGIDSDRLDSYELGGKVSFAGGRGNLNGAVYQNDWSDVPVVFTAPGCLQTTTINGGRARARGVEAEGSFRLFRALQLNFGFGYVDSELTATTSLGARGDRMNFTPKYNGNLGLEYDFDVLGRDAFVRGDYTYFGSYFTETGERGVEADAYSLVNFRAGMTVFNQGEIRFHVDNLLDSDALTAVVGPAGFPPGYGLRLMPRTVGLGLTYKF